MKHTRASRRYANALMGLALDGKSVDSVAADLEDIRSTLRQSRELRLLLGSPIVSVSRKGAVLKELFERRVRPITMAFISLLLEKHREYLLEHIVEQFLSQRDVQEGIVTAEVASTVDLTPSQRKELARELERYTRKRVRLQYSRDESLVGGLYVRIGDTVLDASVRNDLIRLRERFLVGRYPTH
jgi:F-type H+-transporting ATPase subunit delta